MTKDERRNYERFESINLVSFVHFDENYQKTIEDMGRTLDISEGGIMLECLQTIPKNHQVELSIAITDSIVTVRGDVVHMVPIPGTDRFDVGVKFTLISKKDKQIITDYLDQLEAGGPDLISKMI